MSKTIGEKIVRIDFNAEGSAEVDQIKSQTAKLITLIRESDLGRDSYDGEVARLKSLAVTHYEAACQYAVKAVTASGE